MSPAILLALALHATPTVQAAEAPEPTLEAAPPTLSLPAPDPHEPLRALAIEHVLRRKKTNTVGMSVLLGWSIANLGAGAIGWGVGGEPEWVAFHQMNLAWNGVNLALAIPGLVGALRDDPSKYDVRSLIRADTRERVTFGINTGLDVGYLFAGAFLWDLGLRTDDPRFVGFGRSLILQGAFLFVFDLTMLLIHTRHGNAFMLAPELGGDRLGVRLTVPL